MLKLGTILIAIIALLGVTRQVALAESSDIPGQMVIIVTDREAVNESEGGLHLMKSLFGLISTLTEEKHFAFISLDQPSEALGPSLVGDPEFRIFQEQMESPPPKANPTPDPDFVGALEEAYNLLGSHGALPGSTVYLVTGGDSSESHLLDTNHLGPTARLFKHNGWSITGLSLPGASLDTRRLLKEISTDSGGDFFELSIPDGFRELSSKISEHEYQGSLAELGKGVLSSGDILTSILNIAPGTREITLICFRESPYGTLKLISPSGSASFPSRLNESSEIETPHIGIWRLVDPKPGEWKLNVRHTNGMVSIWHYIDNQYSPVLQSYGSVVVNEPATLVAYVTDGERKVIAPGTTSLQANVTTPEGTTLVYDLGDNGLTGDSVAGDGYFSATIAPIKTPGEYKVDLDLIWLNSGRKISSQAGFQAHNFPSIELNTLQTNDLEPGRRSKVATINVHVQGVPYPVPSDQLTGAMQSNSTEQGVLEIKPQRLLSLDRAWAYDVFLTPNQRELHTMVFWLNTEYSGRQYTHTSESVVFSSLLPMVSLDPQPVPVPLRANTSSIPVPPPQPELPRVVPTGSLWNVLTVSIAATVLVLFLGTIYWRSARHPYGYIYNDRNELVADFSNLKRRPLMNLLSKNLVRGKELGLSGFERVSFKFSQKDVTIHSHQANPTVRVNNQPLIGRTALPDRTWIGIYGKLYSFLLSSPRPMVEPSMASDD